MRRRAELLFALADHLGDRRLGHPLRVGIDGPCGSGKSTFATQLVQVLLARGHPAVHLDSDGFHHPRAIRHRQGRDSARGYYDDAYDFDALIERVLRPLGAGAPWTYAMKVHDMATDAIETELVASVPADAIVVFDCTFLQRGRLREMWDDVVYLQVSREIATARGVSRDAASLGGEHNARRAYETRYMAACDIYLDEEDPAGRADVLIDHDDVDRPRVIRGLLAAS